MDDQPPPSSLPQSRHRENQKYRQTKQLPVRVLADCRVWIEEELYSQAFSLCLSLITSGTGTALEAFVPPPPYLALAGTIAVHPLLSTRTTRPGKHAAADDALKYLRHANALLGTQNAGLDQAFQFSECPSASRGKRRKLRVSEVGSDSEDQPDHLDSIYAGKESLWTNAADFWAIVGWAFNCSVAHRHRWERWKVWLEFMLDVLQDDLENRMPGAERLYTATSSTAEMVRMSKDSLLSQYLASIGEGRNGKRRLMRAVLADGKQKSMAEFGEIWKNETKPPKEKADERTTKRKKLDLDNGEFGDYYDESEDDSQPNSARQSRSTTAPPTNQLSRAASADEDSGDDSTSSPSTSLDTLSSLGGLPSLRLRQRLLALLSHYCTKNPDAFLDTEDLFDLYTEFLRPLALPLFQQFVLPTKPYLGPNSQASLNQMLLRPLLANSAPAYNENALTQREFEAYYAPFAASNSNPMDNAKVSLLVESLLRLLWEAGALEVTMGLRRAVERGVGARKEKAGWDGRRKGEGRVRAAEEAMAAMEFSADRMMEILDMAG